jgi:hypothetical protein
MEYRITYLARRVWLVTMSGRLGSWSRRPSPGTPIHHHQTPVWQLSPRDCSPQYPDFLPTHTFWCIFQLAATQERSITIIILCSTPNWRHASAVSEVLQKVLLWKKGKYCNCIFMTTINVGVPRDDSSYYGALDYSNRASKLRIISASLNSGFECSSFIFVGLWLLCCSPLWVQSVLCADHTLSESYLRSIRLTVQKGTNETEISTELTEPNEEKRWLGGSGCCLFLYTIQVLSWRNLEKLSKKLVITAEVRTLQLKRERYPMFSRQLADRWRWGFQPYAPASLYPQEGSWYSFLLEAESPPEP